MRTATIAVLALVLLAGCTGTSGTAPAQTTTATTSTGSPTETQTATETSTPFRTETPARTPTPHPPLNESEFRTEYVEQLRVNDVDVDDAYYERGTLTIRYRTHSENRSAVASELFMAAAWYPRLLQLHDGHEPRSVRLWVKTAAGEKIAHFTVRRSLARDRIRGDVNRTTFRTRILETATR